MYTKCVLDECKPKRIVALGGEAVESLTGRRLPMMSVRRGYTYLDNNGNIIPVFFVMHPAAVVRNRILESLFESDLEWALTCDLPDPAPISGMYSEVCTVADAVEAVDIIRESAILGRGWIAYDLEWSGNVYGDFFEVVTAAVAVPDLPNTYVWSREALNDRDIRYPLLNLLEDTRIGKVGHNLKGDNSSIHSAYGVVVRPTYGDTYLWRRLLETGVNGKLEVCAELVGMGGHKEEHNRALEGACNRIYSARRGERDLFWDSTDPIVVAAVKCKEDDAKTYAYGLVEPSIRHRYCALDAMSTMRLGVLLDDRLQKSKPLSNIWEKVVVHTTDAVRQIEQWGVAVDRGGFTNADILFKSKLTTLENDLRRVGCTINYASPQQVAGWLYNDLELKEVDGRSTSTDVLQRYKDKHPSVPLLLEHRKVGKLASNYGGSLIKHIGADGRIHPVLKIAGTRTGRLSCVSPPLQTLPNEKKNELARVVKSCFIASAGYELLSFDYSQIELRIAAMLSGDRVMQSLFEGGTDFHTGTAKLIAKKMWGISPDDVGPEHRRAAKTFNFGLIYGMQDKSLASGIGCTVTEARELRRLILGEWIQLRAYLDSCVNEARRTGYTYTWWDGDVARIRSIYNVGSQDSLKRSNAENAAANTRVQGTASEFTLASINQIVEWILRDRFPAKVVLTIHDSIILEVLSPMVDECINVVKGIMTSHNSCGVPLVVDAEIGKSLGALEKV
jgi:DNA polymerase I-like protein with 3'-5' exonuclease and polymerase domains